MVFIITSNNVFMFVPVYIRIKFAQEKRGALRAHQQVKQYLAFRHFFNHAYAFEINPDRLVALVEGAKDLFKKLRQNIEK